MEVVISESGIADLEDIVAHYACEGVPEIGTRLVTEVVARIESLKPHPDLGRIVPEFQQPHIREIIHPPFRIVYLREEKSIRVIRIWRNERLLVLPEGR